MEYTVIESKAWSGDWRVECVEPNDGAVSVVTFSGFDAEKLAKEYASWKNRQMIRAVD